MRTTMIAAVARNGAIGRDNRLIYWLPNDLKRFKALTMGHTIVMGRRTFESLPKGALPGRRNVVLTRRGMEGVAPFADVSTHTSLEFRSSLDEALRHCAADEDIYIIGGASVYAEAMPIADRLCLTLVDDAPADADAFFPDYSQWQECWREEHDVDERHAFRYAFVDFTRPQQS